MSPILFSVSDPATVPMIRFCHKIINEKGALCYTRPHDVIRDASLQAHLLDKPACATHLVDDEQDVADIADDVAT